MVHHPFERDIPDTEAVLASIRRAIESDFTAAPSRRGAGFAGILGGDEPHAESSSAPPRGEARPLVSQEAELRMRAAFRRLNENNTVRQRFGGQTVDEASRDYLHAAIQRWLDENLPALTERLIREEIERVLGSRQC